MSDMIERVARAMLEQDPKNRGGLRWKNAVAPTRRHYMVRAALAIEAMREPTEAMIVSGVHHDNMGDMVGCWRAMIDAALAGKAP